MLEIYRLRRPRWHLLDEIHELQIEPYLDELSQLFDQPEPIAEILDSVDQVVIAMDDVRSELEPIAR